MTVVLFLRNVPERLQRQLGKSFAHQRLVVELAEDEVARDRLARVLRHAPG